MMNPRTLPQEQLVEWIRDCHAFCDGADKRVVEQLYSEALDELRVLFEEYLRRFPGSMREADDLLH